MRTSVPETEPSKIAPVPSPVTPDRNGTNADLKPEENDAAAKEVARLAALHRYEILDTPSESVFDDFTRMAAAICGTPISVISLIDKDRQWFKSRVGLDVVETPRSVAFCDHTIQQPDALLEVADARQDARFSDNPLVTGDPNIRFYAGAPLVTPEGYALGSLCVVDQKPQTLSPDQRDALQALARQVMAQLELRRTNAILEREVNEHSRSREKLRRSEERFLKFKERQGKRTTLRTKGAQRRKNPFQRITSLSFESGLATWLGLLATTLFLISVICVTSVRRVIVASEQQQHALVARASVGRLLSSIKDAETGQRGYLLTGKAEYLTPYTTTLRLLDSELAQMSHDIPQDAASRAHAATLTQLTRQKVAEMGTTIQSYRRGDRRGAIALVKEGEGENLMRRIRSEGNALLNGQITLATQRGEEQSEALRRLTTSFFLSLGLALCMMGTIYRRTQRELRLRRQLEDEAFEAQERFRQLSAGSFEGVCISRNGVVIDASDKFCQMFGYSQENIKQTPSFSFVTAEERERVSKIVAHNDSIIYESVGQRRDGSQFPLEICGRSEYIDGVLTRVTSMRDITERKQIEVALQDVNGEFARLNQELAQTNDELEMRVSSRTEQLRQVNDDLAGANTQLQSANERQNTLTQSLHAVLNVTDDLLACPTSDTLLRRAVELGRARIGLERCGIFLTEGTIIRGTYGTDIHGQTVDEHQITLPQSGFWGASIPTGEADGKRWHVAYDEEAFYGQGEQVIRTGQRSWTVATPITSTQGTVGLFFNDAAPSGKEFDPDFQDIVGVYCSLLGNILERKRTEDALQRSEERYRSLVQSTSQIVWTTPPNGQVQDMPMWRDFTGQTVEATHGYGWLNAIHPDDRAHTQHTWEVALRNRVLYETEYRIRRKDGVYRLFVVRGTPVLEPNGTLREWVGTCTDIEDARHAEVALREAHTQLRQANDELETRVRHRTEELAHSNSALRESETRLRAIVANAPTILFEVDQQGIIRLEEGRGVEALGHKPDEVVGRSVYEVYKDAPHFTGNVSQALRGLATTSQVQIGDHSFETAYTPIYDADSRIISVTGVATDVSARVEAERIQQRFTRELQEANAELERSNAELAQFAYVASHDLQEPLRMVSSYTQMIARRYKGKLDDDADEFIGYAVDGVHRMQRLIKDLLAYSRVGSQGGSFVPVDMNRVYDRALLNLRLAIEEAGATVTCDELPTVEGDSGQLGQLLQNLVGNALKFQLPDVKPEISLSVRLMTQGEEIDEEMAVYLPIGNSGSKQEWLFCVRDNGIGMEAQHQERIFAIFQRLHAREEYEGTGIGLAICKKIVERHGGRIWVESQPGQGSAFCWTMPVHSSSPQKVNEIKTAEFAASPSDTFSRAASLSHT